VLVNLLSNAVKFSDKGSTVTVSVDTDDDVSTIISVADTGIGMSVEEVAQAFEPFVKVRHETISDHEGTGLGLSLAKRLVEAHRGNLMIESEPGIGTTVKVEFPKDNVVV